MKPNKTNTAGLVLFLSLVTLFAPVQRAFSDAEELNPDPLVSETAVPKPRKSLLGKSGHACRWALSHLRFGVNTLLLATAVGAVATNNYIDRQFREEMKTKVDALAALVTEPKRQELVEAFERRLVPLSESQRDQRIQEWVDGLSDSIGSSNAYNLALPILDYASDAKKESLLWQLSGDSGGALKQLMDNIAAMEEGKEKDEKATRLEMALLNEIKAQKPSDSLDYRLMDLKNTLGLRLPTANSQYLLSHYAAAPDTNGATTIIDFLVSVNRPWARELLGQIALDDLEKESKGTPSYAVVSLDAAMNADSTFLHDPRFESLLNTSDAVAEKVALASAKGPNGLPAKKLTELLLKIPTTEYRSSSYAKALLLGLARQMDSNPTSVDYEKLRFLRELSEKDKNEKVDPLQYSSPTIGSLAERTIWDPLLLQLHSKSEEKRRQAAAEIAHRANKTWPDLSAVQRERLEEGLKSSESTLEGFLGAPATGYFGSEPRKLSLALLEAASKQSWKAYEKGIQSMATRYGNPLDDMESEGIAVLQPALEKASPEAKASAVSVIGKMESLEALRTLEKTSQKLTAQEQEIPRPLLVSLIEALAKTGERWPTDIDKKIAQTILQNAESIEPTFNYDERNSYGTLQKLAGAADSK